MSTQEVNECKNRADAFTQALKVYYQQLGASQYNFSEVLDALITLTDFQNKKAKRPSQGSLGPSLKGGTPMLR